MPADRRERGFSEYQDQRAGRPAAFEIGVRLRRFGKRVPAGVLGDYGARAERVE
jgi:hypothetical protein